MTWSELTGKLASRKLWLAIVGVAVSVALALGASEGEIRGVVGAVGAVLSSVTYILGEAHVDAARAASQKEGT